MAANPTYEFDIGPLSWVKTEIDHSLSAARDHLDKAVQAGGDDSKPLVKEAVVQLHQACGALSMVGLAAGTRFLEELEAAVKLAEEDSTRLASIAPLGRRAIAMLSAYLDSLVAGETERPMMLARLYVELNRARGESGANDGDLFYPPLSAPIALPLRAGHNIAPDIVSRTLIGQRANYQQALVKVLRGTNATEGLQMMLTAMSAVESLQVEGMPRAFWNSAVAFFEALGSNALAITPQVKQLFPKLDQQVKRVIDGVGEIPPRLFSDVLLAIGRARPVTERITEIQRAYKLNELLALPDMPRGGDEDEETKIVIRELKELFAVQKDTWLRFTSGNRAAIDGFEKQANHLAQRSQKLPNKDVASVLAALAQVAPPLKAKQLPASETQALEVATALLFTETALDNFFRLGSDFPEHAQVVTQRLKAAMSGEKLPEFDARTAQLLDDMTQRAQERLLVFQVGQEVQVNLQTIEAALDSFFRDPAKRDGLNKLAGQFGQVQGAFTIMELDDATKLNSAVLKKVEGFADGSLSGTGVDAELVADGLSALSLYITALQQGQSAPRDVLIPALVRFGIIEVPVAPVPTVTPLPPLAPIGLGVTTTVLPALDALTSGEATLIIRPDTTRVQVPVDMPLSTGETTIISPKSPVSETDSPMLADLDLSSLSKTAPLPTLATTLSMDEPARSVQSVTIEPIIVPTAKLERTDEDDELLEIFLEEAAEVVVTIGENYDTLESSPENSEAMITIRRSFHTLKGSGRMVGLMELGEVGWQCEQVMNKWLKDEKPASSLLMEFIHQAQTAFATWVISLQETRVANIDASELVMLADRLKNDEPSIPVVLSTDDATIEAEQSNILAIATATSRPTAEIESSGADATEDVARFEASLAGAIAFERKYPEEEPDLVIGDAHLSPSFFSIYLGEAEQHLAALQREMHALEAAPKDPISHEFMRAAHTLTSTSRTTGFNAVADVSHPLEKWLQEAMDFPPEMNARRLSVMRESVEALTSMVRSIGRLEPPFAAPQLAQKLVDLREELLQAKKTGEGTHVQLLGVTQHLLALSSDQNEGQRTEETTPLESEIVVPALASTQSVSQLDDTILLPKFDEKTYEATLLTRTIDNQPPPIPVTDPFAFETLSDLDPLVDPLQTTQSSATVDTSDFTDTTIRSVTLNKTMSIPILDEKYLPPVEDHPFDRTIPGEAMPPPIPMDEVTDPFEEPIFEESIPTLNDIVPPPIPIITPTPTPVGLPVIGAGFADLAGLGVISQFTEGNKPAANDSVEKTKLETKLPEPSPTATTVRRPIAEAELRTNTDIASDYAQAESERRVVKDDIDADLLPIFLEEAREILPAADTTYRQWRASGDLAAAAELQRHLHTLKGSARMTGLMRLGELAHVIETKIVGMGTAPAVDAKEWDDVQENLDRFSTNLDRIAAGEDIQMAEVIEPQLARELDQVVDRPGVLGVMVAAQQQVIEQAAMQVAGAQGSAADRVAMMRVPADAIDRFVNQAGELSIARSRIEGELIAFKRALSELTENVARMRGQLREIEIQAETQISARVKDAEQHGENFDPLEFDRFSRMQELTRFMAESVNDLITLQLGLTKNIDETDAALMQQSRLNRDLQQGLMGVRLVPLSSLSDRLYRIVRQTAKELGKKSNLELKGTRVEIDRSVLEKISAPFEHLLRNAVAHGLEMPEQRTALGKSEIGEITIDAHQVGNEVVLTVSDDGQGLNFVRIKEKALASGMLVANEETTEAQLAQFIFMPGFSTADSVSQIAGRGVGMDVVKAEITSLGGRIEIQSQAGKGTSFILTLPLTLAVTQSVMLRAGQTIYAVPSVMVDQVQEYKIANYNELVKTGEIAFKGAMYPLRSLLPMLGEFDTPLPLRQIPVLLLRSGSQRAAIRVDEILGNREVVVKTIGPQLARLPGVSGATVLGNGQVVLILNPVQLVHRGIAVSASAGAAVDTASRADAASDDTLVIEESSGMPLVMVVDDSLTVRKITSRMLLRESFEVVTAKDGVDALQQLQDVRPDVILSDIEMPRMDGFELLRNIRADEGLRNIPIIMITSRTADKHRSHAQDLGCNEYLGKPYQEDQLLALIRKYTNKGETVH